LGELRLIVISARHIFQNRNELYTDRVFLARRAYILLCTSLDWIATRVSAATAPNEAHARAGVSRLTEYGSH
jgi:hypothetical protein